VIFLDEPTAALGVVQTERVLDLIRRVRDKGLGVVLISHSMPEVIKVSDRIEVLRLGRRVAQFRADQTSMEELVAAMTGAISHEEEHAREEELT
jgi:simple sugar transport system ATP-binding protein